MAKKQGNKRLAKVAWNGTVRVNPDVLVKNKRFQQDLERAASIQRKQQAATA